MTRSNNSRRGSRGGNARFSRCGSHPKSKVDLFDDDLVDFEDPSFELTEEEEFWRSPTSAHLEQLHDCDDLIDTSTWNIICASDFDDAISEWSAVSFAADTDRKSVV